MLTQEQIEELYHEHAGVLEHESRNVSRISCLDYVECLSKSHEIFMEYTTNLVEMPQNFGGMLRRIIFGQLIDYARRESWYVVENGIFDELAECSQASNGLELADRLDRLSAEGRNVCMLLLEARAGILGVSGQDAPRTIRGKIRNYLRTDRNMTRRQMWGIMRELQEVFA